MNTILLIILAINTILLILLARFGYKFIISIKNETYAKLSEIEQVALSSNDIMARMNYDLQFREENKKLVDRLLINTGQKPIYSEPIPPQPPSRPKSNLQMIAEEVDNLTN